MASQTLAISYICPNSSYVVGLEIGSGSMVDAVNGARSPRLGGADGDKYPMIIQRDGVQNITKYEYGTQLWGLGYANSLFGTTVGRQKRQYNGLISGAIVSTAVFSNITVLAEFYPIFAPFTFSCQSGSWITRMDNFLLANSTSGYLTGIRFYCSNNMISNVYGAQGSYEYVSLNPSPNGIYTILNFKAGDTLSLVYNYQNQALQSTSTPSYESISNNCQMVGARVYQSLYMEQSLTFAVRPVFDCVQQTVMCPSDMFVDSIETFSFTSGTNKNIAGLNIGCANNTIFIGNSINVASVANLKRMEGFGSLFVSMGGVSISNVTTETLNGSLPYYGTDPSNLIVGFQFHLVSPLQVQVQLGSLKPIFRSFAEPSLSTTSDWTSETSLQESSSETPADSHSSSFMEEDIAISYEVEIDSSIISSSLSQTTSKRIPRTSILTILADPTVRLYTTMGILVILVITVLILGYYLYLK